MYDQWLDFVEQELPKTTGQILDLACGAGRLAVMLAQNGYQVSGSRSIRRDASFS